MKQKKRVVVFDGEQYDGGWPPEDARRCVAWFSEKLESIPSKYRATAKIEIDARGGYEDSYYARIKIYYDRPETDDEENTREAETRRQQEVKKEQELRTLAALKAKYES